MKHLTDITLNEVEEQEWLPLDELIEMSKDSFSSIVREEPTPCWTFDQKGKEVPCYVWSFDYGTFFTEPGAGENKILFTFSNYPYFDKAVLCIEMTENSIMGVKEV